MPRELATDQEEEEEEEEEEEDEEEDEEEEEEEEEENFIKLILKTPQSISSGYHTILNLHIK